jgi:transcriptional regulator with XRE-family HTH domain
VAYRAYEPVKIPKGFWDRADVADALGERDVGTFFRLLRQHGGGLSQTRIGAATGMSQGRVSEIMSGSRRVENIKVLERIADGLGFPDRARRTFGLAAVESGGSGAGRIRVDTDLMQSAPSGQVSPDVQDEDVVVPARTPDGKDVFVTISRRSFLGIGAATGGSIAMSQKLRTPSPLPAFSETTPIEHFDQALNALIRNDNLFGPQQVVPAAEEQISVIQRVRQRLNGVDHQRLLRVQGKYAELCGWLYQDIGEYRAAEYWMDRAFQWSTTAGDRHFANYILARKSQLSGDMRDGLEAVDVGEMALGMAQTHGETAAVAATYAAHGYALNSDRAGTARAYERARNLIADMDVDPSSRWCGWLDQSYLNVHEARSLALLGDFRASVRAYNTAIAALPARYHRDKGVYLARKALAHLGNRDIDEAANAGMEALSIGMTTRSGRIITSLRQLSRPLAKTSNSEPVRRFNESLKDVLYPQR